MEVLKIQSKSRNEFIDITQDIQKIIASSGTIEQGFCMIFVPHTTAGVAINESADPSVPADILMSLNTLVPLDAGYRHMEGNSAAHIKSLLTGVSVTVAIENKCLVLGTWQGIFFCEYDGPRSRKVHVHLSSSAASSHAAGNW